MGCPPAFWSFSQQIESEGSSSGFEGKRAPSCPSEDEVAPMFGEFIFANQGMLEWTRRLIVVRKIKTVLVVAVMDTVVNAVPTKGFVGDFGALTKASIIERGNVSVTDDDIPLVESPELVTNKRAITVGNIYWDQEGRIKVVVCTYVPFLDMIKIPPLGLGKHA